MPKISEQYFKKWEVHLQNGLGGTGGNIVTRKKENKRKKFASQNLF